MSESPHPPEPAPSRGIDVFIGNATICARLCVACRLQIWPNRTTWCGRERVSSGPATVTRTARCQGVDRDMRQHARSARWLLGIAVCAGLALAARPAASQPAQAKPNILVLFGDDIGMWNVSAYNHGMMGYRTPNIDRIAKE